MAPNPQKVFLDANVLAAPVTRTLLLVGIEAVEVAATWSEHAEREANRHLRSSAMSITDLRLNILEADLSPSGVNADRFQATKSADRQILADAIAADAAYIITNDVDDFADVDLITEKVAAVAPDLFMALRFTKLSYHRALAQLVSSLNNPPKTIAEMHTLIGRKHRRLHDQFDMLYPDSNAVTTPMHEPNILYRGARCVVCGRSVRDPRRFELGSHPECAARGLRL